MGRLPTATAQVIGINTLLENPTGQSVNVGVAFAVPINTATSDLSALEGGQTSATPGWASPAGRSRQALAKDLNLPVTQGVYVVSVAQNRPAQR